MKKQANTLSILLLLLINTACIHKSSGPTTPVEKVATYNAAFADLNNSIERGTEALTTSGVLSAQKAMPILLWTSQVATAHQQITAIIESASASGSVNPNDLTAITGLLDQIKSSGNVLITSGTLGIKNPNSQQTFAADFNALYTLADTILSLLTQLKGQ